MTPEEMYEKLILQTSGRKAKSLAIIQEICREQVRRGSKDFTVATIGTLSKSEGGPATQSIRNKPGGDEYRQLLETWRRCEGASPLKKTRAESWTDDIQLAEHRFLAKDLEHENKRLHTENCMLKAHKSPVIDMRQVSKPSPGGGVDLNDAELRALAHAISDDFLKQFDWSIGKKGQVFDASSRVIYKPGYVRAIEKILSV